MPQRKSRKKKARHRVCKVPGYAYTRKKEQLQELVERLQQQAQAVKLHVELSRQREMVLLDLTLHQEQIICLVNYDMRMATCQQHQQALHEAPTAVGGSALQSVAAALQAQMGLSSGEPVQQQQHVMLQGLHAQFLQRVQQEEVQHQQQLDHSMQRPFLVQSSPSESLGEDEEHQQQLQAKPELLLDQPSHAAAAAVANPMQAHQLPEQQQQQHMQIDSIGYVSSILQAAAADPKQQQRVLTMTAADWSQFFNDSFYKLLPLLELSDRCDEVPYERFWQRTSAAVLAGNASGGSTAVGSVPGGSVGNTTDSQPAIHMQQLEQLVDEWVMLSALALILNPLPVYMATTINHATQVTCAVPPGHFDRVVRRMRLTKLQVRHFATVLEEIARLDNAVMAQGGQLARNAACPSTQVLAAEAERDAGFAAAVAEAAAAAAAVPISKQGAASAATGCAVTGRAADGIDTDADTAASAAAASLQDRGLQATGGEAAAESACGTHTDDDSLAPPPAENLLQRNVGRLPLHALLLLMFNCSTLTRLQLAKCIVASYPFVPMTGAIAASAARLWYQYLNRKQQQQQQEQQPDSADEDEEPAPAQPHLTADEADELCCEGGDALSEALHKQQVQVLQHRRELLDQQLQQWWQEWSGLGLSTSAEVGS